MEKFVIIDGNSLINRAFYGLPMLKSLSGKPCNAVFGFLNMMMNVISTEKPKYLVCVFDAGKHTFRHNLYPDYKGKRDKMPEDLAEQLPMLKQVLRAMNILIIEQNEIEADDIIGSLTRKFDEDFILISGDKDLLQLIKPNTTVWLTQKGISNVLKVDEATLKSHFNLAPYQVIELKSLMGDSSDNIPGIPGVGKVGAQKLIDEFSSLDNVYQNLDKIAPKLREKLIANKELAYLSKQLATIKLDVEIEKNLEDCKLCLPFGGEAYELMRELDFRSILNRRELFAPHQIKQITEETITAQIIEIDSQQSFDEMLKNLTGDFSIYPENMSLNIGTGEVEYVLYTSGEVFKNNLAKFKSLCENDSQKICFDAKFLMHELDVFGINLNNYFDLSIAIYIANENDAEISFSDVLKLNKISTNSNANTLIKLKERYLAKLSSANQLKLYNEIELPLVQVLFEMEKAGIKIDVEQIRALSNLYHDELNVVTAKIYSLAGEEFNINSPKQLQYILFDKLKIEYRGKKGTSIEVLNAIKEKHPIVEYIIRYRKIAKLISTYLDGMLNCVKEDGKIHTNFMQRTTSTGRLSSREPNLQNLPIRDDEGRALRKMFTSSFASGSIVSADYNQIELRLIANFSGDENMMHDYLSNKDIHTATASKIFNLPIEKVDSAHRRLAKSVNFGIIYGISAYGLSQNVGITPKEAANFIEKYLQIYPKVKQYGEECIASAREKGYITTIMGRIRHIPDINSNNHTVRGFAERVAKNTPLQGSASDIIKLAMIGVYNRIKQNNLKSKLILQIHDELVVDCYNGESKIIKQILKEVMENVIHLTVPLIVEVGEGKTLYDAK